ncbi:hypothetical protein L0Z36_27550 [Burkholderia multivorans]|uniref:hypothetical protein n=1 Tax=Burkholderia multivorans TaxID=87883 RepID=UPI0020192582|nr:hypothetical protein [Burkholderia multivorans]UQP03167.1 hypothetical protein L0Z36_27550 [Burkholderia multivorans]
MDAQAEAVLLQQIGAAEEAQMRAPAVRGERELSKAFEVPERRPEQFAAARFADEVCQRAFRDDEPQLAYQPVCPMATLAPAAAEDRHRRVAGRERQAFAAPVTEFRIAVERDRDDELPLDTIVAARLGQRALGEHAGAHD